MTKKEFIQQAAIQLAAALVEPFNNSPQGLNEWIEEKLVIRASKMAFFLADTLQNVAENDAEGYESENKKRKDEILSELNKMEELADKENRMFTYEEQRNYDSLIDKYQKLNEMIDIYD